VLGEMSVLLPESDYLEHATCVDDAPVAGEGLRGEGQREGGEAPLTRMALWKTELERPI